MHTDTTDNPSAITTNSAEGGAAASVPQTGLFEGAEVISTYTRAQAIEDGVLVDLSAVAPGVCAQHYKYPIACTASVWGIIERAVKNEKHCNDLNGVIHDLLWMSRTYKRDLDESTVIFRVKITGAGRQSVFNFKMVCGPGDDAAPVLAIMLPEED